MVALSPDFYHIGNHLAGTEDHAPSNEVYADEIHLVSEVVDEDTLDNQSLVSGPTTVESASRSLLDLSEASLQPLDKHHPITLKVDEWVGGVRQFDVEPEINIASDCESLPEIFQHRAGPAGQPQSLQTGPNMKMVRGKGVLKPTFPCEHCGRLFNNRSELRHHARRYEKRPYDCDFKGCSASFLYPKDLRRHRTTHTGAKQYECPVCPKSFSRKDNLRRHVQNEHGIPEGAMSPGQEPNDTPGEQRRLEPGGDSENDVDGVNPNNATLSNINNSSAPHTDAVKPTGSNGRHDSSESPRNGANADNHATLAHTSEATERRNLRLPKFS